MDPGIVQAFSDWAPWGSISEPIKSSVRKVTIVMDRLAFFLALKNKGAIPDSMLKTNK